MSSVISATRIATLVGDSLTARSPMYAGLADALRLLIGDGRIGLDTRLPSERDLTDALGVSRTTVTRAYAELRDRGFAEARQGAGTFTRLPGGRAAVLDRALAPRAGGTTRVDLNCAATSAPPGLAAVYAEAAADLPAYLSGHGYFPVGLPALQREIAATYERRGLPTAPGQILVTHGALSATAIVAQGSTGPGDRVLVDDPVYPNATSALRHRGARLVPVPVDPDGWDLDTHEAAVRQAAPRLAYLIPDFQNPTGHVMTDEQRERYAATLRRARTVPVVDEAHQALALEGQEMPRPFAAYSPETITIGSASKQFWGGLRLGWIRAPENRVTDLTRGRLGIDLGAPVLEQLVLARVLQRPEAIVSAQLARLREQRDRLVEAMATHLPEWRFVVPRGGLCLWCELPAPVASTLAVEAERRGVVVAPGPVFAVNGGLERFVRVPWTRPVEELETAASVLAEAWAVARSSVSTPREDRVRVV
jgi:DNA-binding transcriptional MocR family regulator